MWLIAGSVCENLHAHEARGPSVEIIASIHSAGLVQRSPSFEIAGFIGHPGTLATSTSGRYVVREGPVGMVVYPTNFAVQPAAVEIKEAGAQPEESTRTQLSGMLVNDDDTLDPVAGSEVAWMSPATEEALASISADGIAAAASVYQDTPASFSGSFAGWTAVGSLLVRNSLDDNFGPMAGNTFDDAWEIANGQTQGLDPDGSSWGLPHWAFFAMDLDPRRPHTNLFPAVLHEGYLTISYRRNPRATGYRFVVEEAQNLDTGFVELTHPVASVYSDANGTETVTVRGSLPMNSANHQFMRVRVEKLAPGESAGQDP